MRRRLFFWLFVAAVVAIAIRRPDWRLAAERAAAPYVERGAASIAERARAWRGVHSEPGTPAPSQPGSPPPSVGEAIRPPGPAAGEGREPSARDTDSSQDQPSGTADQRDVSSSDPEAVSSEPGG